MKRAGFFNFCIRAMITGINVYIKTISTKYLKKTSLRSYVIMRILINLQIKLYCIMLIKTGLNIVENLSCLELTESRGEIYIIRLFSCFVSL